MAHRKSPVAKIVNQYFASLGKVLAKPFQNVSTVFTSSTPPFEFHLYNVNVNFVRNAHKSLKSNEAVGHRIECPVTSGNLTGYSRIRTTIWSLKYGGIIRLRRLSQFFVSDCEILVTKSQWVPLEYLYQETSNSRSYLRLMPAYQILLDFSR